MTRILSETKQVHQQIGIPERGATAPLSELHQRYLSIGKKEFHSALERYARSHYAQVMLSRYKVLEQGDPQMLNFYTKELIDSGCDNPILAAKCLQRLKEDVSPETYQEWKEQVLTKIGTLAALPERELALNGTQYKNDLANAAQQLRAD